jgi:hypothetical protein
VNIFTRRLGARPRALNDTIAVELTRAGCSAL